MHMSEEYCGLLHETTRKLPGTQLVLILEFDFEEINILAFYLSKFVSRLFRAVPMLYYNL